MEESTVRFDRRSRVWPGIVCGLLAGQLAVCGMVIIASSSDASVAVEPNYYEKALAWDQQALQSERNRQLGWSAELSLDPRTDASGDRGVEFGLRDRDGNAICGATVRAIAFHHAHARERLDAELRDGGDGRYFARLPLKLDGLWEFRIHVQHGTDVFTLVREQPIGPLRSAAK